MKKKFIVALAVISSIQNIVCMDPKASSSSTGALGRAAQTVFDKWDPTGILIELNKKGLSTDSRDRMTQMHRLDRVIPAHIDGKETEKLCDNLTTILTKGWPLGIEARDMAHGYLWRLRPSIRGNKPLLDRVTATLDFLDPAQIIQDLQQGQIYTEEAIDLEDRINRALERLVQLKRTSELQLLVGIITDKKTKGSPIIPGERVRQIVYAYLRTQEKETTAKKRMLVTTFGAKKSASDTED